MPQGSRSFQTRERFEFPRALIWGIKGFPIRLYEFVGESIDKLVSLDVRPPHIEQGILEKLYRASREKMKTPLTSLAAEKLKETLNPESLAIISTGLVLPPYFPTNTDALNVMLKRVHDKKKYVIPNLFRNLEFSNDNKLIAFVLV